NRAVGRGRTLLVRARVFAGDGGVGGRLEPAGWEVQLRRGRRELFREPPVPCEPDPVRVDNHVRYPPRSGKRDEVEEIRMDRRLAGREHDDLRIALGGEEAVEHETDLPLAERVAVGLVPRVGET